MKKRWCLLLLWLVLLTAGCAGRANDELARVQVGMNQTTVKQTLGQPEKVQLVRFKGHEDDYLVWEYRFVPDRPT